MVFADPPRRAEERVVDLRGLAPAALPAALGRVLRAEARRPFDLGRAPGLRGLRVLEPGGLVLQITRHHLVSDGWSLGLVLRDLADASERLRAGRPPAPRERALRYADHACRQRADGPPAARPPAFRGRSLRMLGPRRGGPGTARVLRGVIDGRPVAQASRSRRLTPFAVTCGLFALVLGSLLARREVAFGIDVSTRDRVETEACVGTFVNRVPIVVPLPADGGLGAYLDGVAAQVRRAAGDGAVPFEALVAAADPRRGDGYDPLVDVVFGLHAEPRHAPYRGLGRVSLIDLDDAGTHVPLSVYLTADGPCLHSEIRFDDAYLSAATVEALDRAFRAALSTLRADPDADLAEPRRRVLAALGPPTGLGARLAGAAAGRAGG